MSTVNHDAWKREHIRHLATEAAPSRPLWLRPRRRRRIDWIPVVSALVILIVLAACVLMLLALPSIAVR